MSGGEGVVDLTLDPKINALVVKITDAAIMCLDADEEATWRFAAFERGIVGDIAKFRSDALEALQAEKAALVKGPLVGGPEGAARELKDMLEAAHARIAELEAELARAREELEATLMGSAHRRYIGSHGRHGSLPRNIAKHLWAAFKERRP
jgi:multidrug resistance efflux pump